MMPYRICRAMSAVLLLLLPMSTVPRLPGEPVPCGNRLTSTRPSEPDSDTVFVVAIPTVVVGAGVGDQIVPGRLIQRVGQDIEIAAVGRRLKAFDVADDAGGGFGFEHLAFMPKILAKKYGTSPLDV